MDNGCVFCQLSSLRMDRRLDQICCADEDYQAARRESACCLEKMEQMSLSEETRKLMDCHASAQNAMGGRYGELAYRLGFADCMELILSVLQFRS